MNEQLIAICQALGTDKFQIQGPGGNFSVKNDQTLWIKASGVWLKNVVSQSDLTEIRLAEFPASRWPADQTYLQKWDQEYSAWLKDLKKNPTAKRPSMETGFHLILTANWVIHTHGIAETLLGVLPKSCWPDQWLSWANDAKLGITEIEPCLPGVELCAKIYQKRNSINAHEQGLILLKNHGAIWYGRDIDKIKGFIKESDTLLKHFFNFSKYPMIQKSDREIDFSTWPKLNIEAQPLFPDFTVLFKNHEIKTVSIDKSIVLPNTVSSNNAQWGLDMIFMQALLSTIALKYGPVSVYPPELNSKLIDMDSEKHRQRQSQ